MAESLPPGFSHTLSPEARRVVEACDLVRANGYVVVSTVENEMWATWLRESYDRNRKVHDEVQQCLWQIGFLMARCEELLDGRRPRWWRRARKWWADCAWGEPITLRFPNAGHTDGASS